MRMKSAVCSYPDVALGQDGFFVAARIRGIRALTRHHRAVLRRLGQRRRRRPHARGQVLVLLRQQVLQPAVLHLELGDARLEGGIELGGLAHGALELLLALLLLRAEAGAGGGVSSSLVLLGGQAVLLLDGEGARYPVAGRHGAVLGVAYLAVGRRDGRHVRRGVVPRGVAELVDLIGDGWVDGRRRVGQHLVGHGIVDRPVWMYVSTMNREEQQREQRQNKGMNE